MGLLVCLYVVVWCSWWIMFDLVLGVDGVVCCVEQWFWVWVYMLFGGEVFGLLMIGMMVLWIYYWLIWAFNSVVSCLYV